MHRLLTGCTIITNWYTYYRIWHTL